jgi:hypothetical protein
LYIYSQHDLSGSLVEGGFLTFVGIHISFALVVLFYVGVVPVYYCTDVVGAFVEVITVVAYCACFYKSVVAICFAAAG